MAKPSKNVEPLVYPVLVLVSNTDVNGAALEKEEAPNFIFKKNKTNESLIYSRNNSIATSSN